MLCARLMRGTSSSENAVTPRAARASTTAPCVAGCRKLIVTAPSRSKATSSIAGACTASRTSVVESTDSRSAASAAPAAR
jgi:hypothetical protein